MNELSMYLFVKFKQIGVDQSQLRVETIWCYDDNGQTLPNCEGHYWIYPNPEITPEQIKKMEKLCEDYKKETLYYGSAEIC